jgi:hypothetical protein
MWQEGKRRKQGVPPRNWTPEMMAKRNGGVKPRTAKRKVDPAPFLGWLDGWLERNPTDTVDMIARRAGSASRTLLSMKAGTVGKITLEVVDRYLLAANESPHVLDELYPLEDCVAS